MKFTASDRSMGVRHLSVTVLAVVLLWSAVFIPAPLSWVIAGGLMLILALLQPQVVLVCGLMLALAMLGVLDGKSAVWNRLEVYVFAFVMLSVPVWSLLAGKFYFRWYQQAAARLDRSPWFGRKVF